MSTYKIMRAFKAIVVFTILVTVAISCKTAKKDGQGIQGQGFWLERNKRPQVANEGEIVERPAKRGVKRTIRIHEPTHINQARLGDALLDDIETPFVKEIETDES